MNFHELQEQFSKIVQKQFKETSVDKLKTEFQATTGTEGDKKSALDQSFRNVLISHIIKDKLNIPMAEKFISYSVMACRNDIVSTTMPVVLLGDIFDAVTLDQCELMFSFVENNVSVWKEDLFFAPCKNNLLRMCNDLLRRLSRSQNTVFCGRILLFLAKFFPFSERSGLNIVSEFNLENLTEYGNDGKDNGEGFVDVSEITPLQIDYNLYCKFWALQDFFRNPNQCYNIVQWKTFSSHAENVLSAFKSFKLEEPRLKSKDTSNDVEMKDVTETEELNLNNTQHFFAKFLTNPKLLSLQLSDSNFRRSVLVQFLILFQYLTSQVKFKSDSYSLNPAQGDWIKETESLIFRLLEETPPDGKKFCKSVQHMLQREELWNNWKNEGCKEFKKPEALEDESPTKKPVQRRPKRHLGDIIKDASKQGKFFMGSQELTRLWNLCPDNLQACKVAERNFLPNVETYLENPKEKSDPSFEWRALRLLARQSPHFFTMFNTPSSSSKVSDYLESVRKKIAKERTEVLNVKSEVVEEEEVVMEQNENIENEEPEEENDLLKTEQLTPEHDHNKNHAVNSKPTSDQFKLIGPVIGAEWKRLGTKLGYAADEILFFETENSTVSEQCQAMLKIWFDDDMDASWDNLAYILEGLKMNPAAELVKSFIGTIAEDLSE